MAATGYAWLSFSTGVITVSTTDTSLSGTYNLRYKCTLDDADASVEWTPITYYLVSVTVATQADIHYILN